MVVLLCICSNSDSRLMHCAAQKLISVMGPGVCGRLGRGGKGHLFVQESISTIFAQHLIHLET
jgi:hypothetical protein